MKKVVYELVVIDWTEYERGWGQRPDGWTVYKTMAAAKAHIAEDVAEKSKTGGYVPNEYSSPGEPHTIRVDKKTHDELVKRIGKKTRAWGGPNLSCPHERVK